MEDTVMPETSAPVTHEPAPVVPNVIPKPQGDPAELGDAGKKAIATERARADAAEKSIRDLQAKLDVVAQEKLSDLEKAQKAASDATAQLAEYQATVARQKVAIAKGVPADLVDRLRGTSEDELSADADALLALLHAPTSPRPDPSQGARGNLGPATTADLFAAALGGALNR